MTDRTPQEWYLTGVRGALGRLVEMTDRGRVFSEEEYDKLNECVRVILDLQNAQIALSKKQH